MRGYQLTAVVEREGDTFIAHCLELDIASRGFSGAAALASLKDVVASFLANAEEAEIEERLVRDVEVRLFDVELTQAPVWRAAHAALRASKRSPASTAASAMAARRLPKEGAR